MKQEKTTLEITGMTCDHCATGIEKLFDGKKGILEKKVSYKNGKGEFTYDANTISKDDIISTINQTGSYKVNEEAKKELILQSVITCPKCGHQKEETMPTDACQYFYECGSCKAVLKPKEGDCCVFCSYGSVPCPPIQENDDGGKGCGCE